MTYDIIWSETAEAEADAAFLWFTRTSPDFARRWYSGLLEVAGSLDEFPTRCPLAPENEDVPTVEVRHLLYRTGRTVYRIIFCILNEDTVRILYIRHGAQQTRQTSDKDDA